MMIFFGIIVMVADAFPPAPHFSIHGIVRDQYGWGLGGNSDAEIVFQAGGEEVVRGQIGRALVSENFRVTIPMDNDLTSAYLASAQSPGVSLSVHLEISGQTFPLVGLGLEGLIAGKPGESVRLDLAMGEDSDGDGLPDSWEFWQLELAGLDQGDEGWSLDRLGAGDADGDGMSDRAEFIAGTRALSADDFFVLKLIKVGDDGWQEYEFFELDGKTYQVERSLDMKVWQPVMVYLYGSRAEASGARQAESSGLVSFERPPIGAEGQKEFYRVLVR